jgi:hypothetical protein
MKGRLVFPSISLAMLILAATGCSESKRNTDLGGTPTVRQVFVDSTICPGGTLQDLYDRCGGNGLRVDDPSGQGSLPGAIDGNDLTFGLQTNVGPCNFDATCDTGLTCNTDFICADSGGKQPGVSDAILTADATGGAPVIQIVFDTIVKGDTVGEFWCACSSVNQVSLDAGQTAMCPGNKLFTKDATCGDCPDNPMTSTDDETGKCVDLDGDGVSDGPDIPRIAGGKKTVNSVADAYPPMIAGIVTITCNSTPAFTWSNVEPTLPATTTAILSQDGYYDPSGDQFVTSDTGFEGLGPRIYVTPNIDDPVQAAFPSDSTCNLTLNGLTDKAGAAITIDSAQATWKTAPCQVVATNVTPGATGVALDGVEDVEISFNTNLDDTTAGGSVTVAVMGGANVPGTSEVDPTSDSTLVVFTPDAPFAAGTTYVVTIHGGANAVKEAKYGKNCPAADKTFTFATTAAKPTRKPLPNK